MRFLHILALALGRTIGELSEMSEAEFRSWRQFYEESPFDDLHRYHRPAAMVGQLLSSSVGYEDRLDWLINGVSQPTYSKEDGQRFSEADLRTFEALGLSLKGAG